MKVLLVTSQWPTKKKPGHSPFVKVERDAICRVGAEVAVFHYPGGWHPTTYARAILAYQRAIRREMPDVVYIRFGQCGTVTLGARSIPMVARFGGSDLIGWRNSSGQEPIGSKLLRAASNLTARRAREVIIPNEKMGSLLPRSDYHVIPSGIDMSIFKPMGMEDARRKLKLPQDRNLILFAADPKRIVKRFFLAQETVQLLNQHEEVELIVASNVPHHQMPIYMNASNVLLLTSSHEGSPNVVKEAMACNLPIVSTDVGDVRDRIGKLEGCMVTKEDSPNALAGAVLKIWQNNYRPELRSHIQFLNVRAVAQKTLQVFQQAIDRR